MQRVRSIFASGDLTAERRAQAWSALESRSVLFDANKSFIPDAFVNSFEIGFSALGDGILSLTDLMITADPSVLPFPGADEQVAYASEGGKQGLNERAPAQATNNRLLFLREQFIWPELTCFICAGTSVVDCVKCVGGATTVYEQEQVAFNRVNGTPVFAPKAVRVPCPVCDGKGGFDCRNCKQGRLPLD